MLLTELLKKIQFRHNQSQLEELDDESLDDDVSYPWIVLQFLQPDGWNYWVQVHLLFSYQNFYLNNILEANWLFISC